MCVPWLLDVAADVKCLLSACELLPFVSSVRQTGGVLFFHSLHS